MRISRIAISNFRNFCKFDVPLHDHAVFVGANGVGKSNLLHALRLVLDPSLPDTSRHLRDEDFWDGFQRPLGTDARIEVIVELSDFDESDEQLASLAEHLVQTEPMVARLTYVFQPKPGALEPLGFDDFEFFVFGGEREENRVGYELRRRMPLDLFHALRDAEADLASWRRSPLRPLLDRAWTKISGAEKETLAEDIAKAASALTGLDALSELEKELGAALLRLAGPVQATDVQLGVAPTEAEALIRIVRLLLDNGRRTVGDTSLGLANVLYLTLKLLELEHLVKEHERDHTFAAIEEPEAHLHPHLQRQVFREFLRFRPHLPTKHQKPMEAFPTTVLLTTHSPHLVSVAPLRSIVRMWRVPVDADGERTEVATIGASTVSIGLEESEEHDLERYIEVSRAEMLFANGVLLVEGEAEAFLVPRIAELQGVPLNSLGISVCAVGGTHFKSYVSLLKGLSIPFAVITDGDPDVKPTGETRVEALLRHVLGATDYETLDDGDDRARSAREHGLFVGQTTFEIDLLHAGRRKSIPAALRDLATSDAARVRAEGWLGDPKTIDEKHVLRDIASIGKGRFGQHLATILREIPPASGKKAAQGPGYVLDAIDYLSKAVRIT
jgi:putative ATP-dependent endonuclease of OLD family